MKYDLGEKRAKEINVLKYRLVRTGLFESIADDYNPDDTGYEHTFDLKTIDDMFRVGILPPDYTHSDSCRLRWSGLSKYGGRQALSFEEVFHLLTSEQKEMILFDLDLFISDE